MKKLVVQICIPSSTNTSRTERSTKTWRVIELSGFDSWVEKSFVK